MGNDFLKNLKDAVDSGEFNSEAAKKIIEIDTNANNVENVQEKVMKAEAEYIPEEDVLKSAAISAATQGVGSEISDALGSGTDVLTADDLYTGQAMTDLANSGDGGFSGAYTTPIDNPVYGDFYDAKPLIDPTEYGGTGLPFGSIEEPLVDNYMDGFTSTSETGLATLPEEGMMPDLPGTTLLGDLGLAGAVETPIPSSSISISQALRGLNLAKGLLGGGQEGAAAPATQFRGARLPQGEVDYSGILNLLQMRSPQRTSLLG